MSGTFGLACNHLSRNKDVVVLNTDGSGKSNWLIRDQGRDSALATVEAPAYFPSGAVGTNDLDACELRRKEVRGHC
jgi:hypothetical protein